MQENSLAHELGLEPGTQLLSVDGRVLSDSLDWEFLTADDRFVLSAELPNGEFVEYDIQRPEGLPLGVELEPSPVTRCVNRCEFCFVKGNPKGLRKTLYVKDDDYRLSFLHGNFVTLTNLEESDLDRILEYHLSPLYVSVHATDLAVRRQILGNPNAPDVLQQLKRLAAGGVVCHTQVVLQPGSNDGPVLEHTLDQLFELGDAVLSASVVPVGFTDVGRNRQMRLPTRNDCRSAIDAVDAVALRARAGRGSHWAYGSDELYLRAHIELPAPERYDGFEQLENGVGCIRHLETRVAGFAADLSNTNIVVATGTAMAPFMTETTERLECTTGAKFDVVTVENTLFGPSVTTAGLLPGKAFASALADFHDRDLALITAESVNDEGLFLDDMSVESLRDVLPMELRLSHCFVDVLGNGES